MNYDLKMKLAAKKFINDYKLYYTNEEIYMVHVDNYNNDYQHLSKRNKIKFTFDLFKKIIDENAFNNLTIGILWDLNDVNFIEDFLSPFEIISSYLDSITPPLITITSLDERNIIIENTIKKQEIKYQEGKIVFYFYIRHVNDFFEQKIITYYEPNI